MARRITTADLKSQVRIINTLTNNPQKPYFTNEEGHYQAEHGCYYLDSAFGRIQLVQMVVTARGSGEKDILPRGYHCPKRELYYRLEGFIAGIEGMANSDD